MIPNKNSIAFDINEPNFLCLLRYASKRIRVGGPISPDQCSAGDIGGNTTVAASYNVRNVSNLSDSEIKLKSAPRFSTDYCNIPLTSSGF